MRTLLTGATGFIGGHVLRELVGRGREVRVLVRPRSNLANLAGLDVERVSGDVTDPESLDRAMRGCDVLYHVAGLYSSWEPDVGRYYRVNFLGVRHALAAAERHGASRVVLTSSVATLHPTRNGVPVDERAEFESWGGRNHYGLSKYLGELEARRFARGGLPVVIVNPSGVVGDRDIYPTPLGRVLIQIARGRLPFYAEGGANWVDVRDVARGHLLAEERGKSGEKYILGAENMTVREFLTLAAEVAGVAPPRFPIPKAAALAAGALCEVVASVTRKPPPLTLWDAEHLGFYEYFDNRKAREELGVNFGPVREALHRAIEWFRAEGRI